MSPSRLVSHLVFTLADCFFVTVRRIWFGFWFGFGMKVRRGGDVFRRTNTFLGLLKLHFGHFDLAGCRAVDLETVHDLVDLTIVDGV